MPDRDDKNRDNATNKLLNILRTESSETGKGEKVSHSTDKPSGEESLDSKKLTELFDQATSRKKGKPGEETFNESEPEQKKDEKKSEEEGAPEDLSRFMDLKKIKADTPEEDTSREEKSKEEKPKEKEKEPEEEPKEEEEEKEAIPDKGDETGLNIETPKISLTVDKEEKKKTEQETEQEPDKEPESPEVEKDSEDLDALISDTEETSNRVGPFVEFKTRFEDREAAPPEEVSSEDQEKASEEGESLLTFLDKQPRESTEEEKETATGIGFKGEKPSRDGKSIFDILDEYIATKNDDVVLPIKETEELSLETPSPAPPSEPAGDEKKKDEKVQEPETPVDKSLITEEEEEKQPKSATQKILYDDFENEKRSFDDLLEEEEDEDRVFDEKFNSVSPAVKLKISEISDWLNNKRNIVVVETDDSSARYLQAAPEVNKIKITNWGILNYWNFPEDATDEDKHKFALRSISRQIKHKKSFLTYFTHSRNYVSRIQNFQKLSKKEIQEALKWAVSKNLPFPDKAIEYDVKQVSSDSVDEKNFLTLIAPHNLVAQQEKYFQDVGMNPRQITTVSYLASKAFRLNYPDYFKETAIIFYMGESYSNLIFIKNHEFHYEREFSIGRKDLLGALNQEVNTLNGPRKLSTSDALLLLDTYGFQRKTASTIKSLGIDYSRYSIMIRPIAERIIMEISRSIDYYRKTFSLLADGDVFLVGPGAVIPGIARFIEDQLGRRTSVLNPMRADIFAYKSKESEIPEKLLPCYTLHLAAAYPDKDLNVITKATRNREIFIAGTKLTHLILAVFLIFSGIRTYDMLEKRDQVEADYRRTRTRWQNISDVSTTFMSMSEKEQTLTQILNQIRMDQYSTDRTLTFLKMISNLTPAGIHLIDFQLNKPVDDSSKDKSDFILKGYITRNPSVADIYLNNYLAKFRDTGFFESIELSTDDERTETGTRRTFIIKGVLKKL
ncbi:pilus assembly protein PilM [Fidelibacter multiformis]|uniref:pilus assembly protein PilM n=1 Tax=Fidelibacter multiformis TaxID=3377529 RepID=UPI0037DCA9BB